MLIDNLECALMLCFSQMVIVECHYIFVISKMHPRPSTYPKTQSHRNPHLPFFAAGLGNENDLLARVPTVGNG